MMVDLNREEMEFLKDSISWGNPFASVEQAEEEVNRSEEYLNQAKESLKEARERLHKLQKREGLVSKLKAKLDV